jgi:hypothetical protein
MNPDSELGKLPKNFASVRRVENCAFPLETTSGTAAKDRFNVATLVGATSVVIFLVDRFSAAIAGSGAASLQYLRRGLQSGSDYLVHVVVAVLGETTHEGNVLLAGGK